MKDKKSQQTRCGRIDACIRKLKRVRADLPDRCEGESLLRNVIESLEAGNIPMALNEINIIISQPIILPVTAFRQLNPIQTELHSIPKELPWKKWLAILALKMPLWLMKLYLKEKMNQWFPMNCTNLLNSKYIYEPMLQQPHP
ncbi:hypothetical protein P0Y35_14860 [Kiritimatiellaeota bacterium B1221]|nr:hypothetical protein [Kiritimatiellaeota bacterium B1221]